MLVPACLRDGLEKHVSKPIGPVRFSAGARSRTHCTDLDELAYELLGVTIAT
jgi:hypothetical protein